MHIDTAFPCSLQEAGLGYEGGWTFDYDGDDINPWTDSQSYGSMFAGENPILCGRECMSMGWNQ